MTATVVTTSAALSKKKAGSLGWVVLVLLAHCEMGIYTSMFFVEMNVVPMSGGQ